MNTLATAFPGIHNNPRCCGSCRDRDVSTGPPYAFFSQRVADQQWAELYVLKKLGLLWERHTFSGAGKWWDQGGVPATQTSTTFRSEGEREVSWTTREEGVTEEKALSACRELKHRASRKRRRT